jgi:hypothetical protein
MVVILFLLLTQQSAVVVGAHIQKDLELTAGLVAGAAHLMTQRPAPEHRGKVILAEPAILHKPAT